MNKLTFASVLALTLGLSLPAAAQPNLDDVNARCCGANCCSIDGVRRDQGDVNPANACEVCDQASACGAWTNICDAGAGETDAGPIAEVDAGPIAETDAGPVAEVDAGPTGGTDAGPTGGIDAGPEAGGGGCSVTQSNSRSFGAVLAIAAIGLLFRRRRS